MCWPFFPGSMSLGRETIERALDPFFTSKEGKRVGLGLALLSQSAQETGGTVTVESAENRGTTVHARFSLEHIDCRPLGDMSETLRVLRACHPHIEFTYESNVGVS